MSLIIQKDRLRTNGSVILPASKSISNRALIIHKLCAHPFVIRNLSEANDTQELYAALNSNTREVYSGDGGTTFRFLTAYLSTTPGKWILNCSDSMKKRPVGDLVEALNNLGAEISYLEQIGFPPLEITGKKMAGGKIPLYAGVSSQFVSALCMIAPALENGMEIHLDGKVVSASYIHMTLLLMEHFGIKYTWLHDIIEIKKQEYQPRDISIEQDWSVAAAFYELVSLSDSAEIHLNGLKRDSLQGDAVLPEIYSNLGVTTTFQEKGIVIKREGAIANSFEFNFSDCPDLVQYVAVTCAAHSVYARLQGIDNLHLKETNRIEALRTQLQKFGTELTHTGNEIKIDGNFTAAKGLEIAVSNDHRMAMSFAPLAMKTGEIVIDQPEVVAKSFPHFWEQLMK